MFCRAKNLRIIKRLVSSYNDPDSIVINGQESNKFFELNAKDFKSLDNLSFMMAMDLLTYMPD